MSAIGSVCVVVKVRCRLRSVATGGADAGGGGLRRRSPRRGVPPRPTWALAAAGRSVRSAPCRSAAEEHASPMRLWDQQIMCTVRCTSETRQVRELASGSAETAEGRLGAALGPTGALEPARRGPRVHAASCGLSENLEHPRLQLARHAGPKLVGPRLRQPTASRVNPSTPTLAPVPCRGSGTVATRVVSRSSASATDLDRVPWLVNLLPQPFAVLEEVPLLEEVHNSGVDQLEEALASVPLPVGRILRIPHAEPVPAVRVSHRLRPGRGCHADAAPLIEVDPEEVRLLVDGHEDWHLPLVRL